MSIILLENIRSIFNVGSIFRLADATGAEKILLIGYTATPHTRLGNENVRLAKTALGAEQLVLWEQFSTAQEALQQYADYTPVVVERTEKSVNYRDCQFSNPIFIFGNEVDGVAKTTQDYVETHIHLPMRGTKASINVATAAAVILYHHAQ